MSTLIALLVAFAFGVLVALDASDRHATPCKLEPAPAAEPAPARESLMLTHPLRCEWGYVSNCADFAPCKSVCAARVQLERKEAK